MYVEPLRHDGPRPDEDQRVVLHDVDWAQFEAILAIRGETTAPRITYVDGELELMSPSRAHEGVSALLGRMIEAYADHSGLEWNAFGSWLLKHAADERGVEPDQCYVFDDRPTEVPELVVEVVWTSGGLPKLDSYRRFGVREVWFWQRSTARIEVFELTDGDYRARERSVLLPGLVPREIERFLDYEHQSQSLRAFRAWLSRTE